jgi:O-antigen/teichoic acid export membrane protein
MSGYTLTNLAINAVGLFLSITLNILLVPEYGIEGSAIAVSLSLFAMNVGRVYLAWKYIGIHPYDINYFKPVIAIGLVILALIASGFGYDESYGIGPLVLLVSASMCLYCVLIYAFGLNEDDKYILERIASRFKRN